jgi:hypothetical protein
MSLDLTSDYKKAKDQINSYKGYLESKSAYDSITEPKGDSFEQDAKNIKESIDKIKDQNKKFQRQVKNQLEQLLDIKTTLGGTGGSSLSYIRKTFIKVLKIIEPILKEILLEEAFNAVRCDLDQSFSARDVYIKVSSIDVFGLLKLDPTTDPGILMYEKKPIQVQTPKFSMNRELYERIQSTNSFSQSYGGRFYKGASGQDMFDIQFVQTNNLGETGPFYKISILDRADGLNKVKSFLIDYYQSISIVEFSVILANIMNALSGCIQISANFGISQNTEATKFSLFIQRVLGLCFDNVREIDVSGNAKVAELDGVDESFYEFTDLDLRIIEETVENLLNGVTELEDCNNIKIPINVALINEALNKLRLVPDDDQVDAANGVLDSFANSVDQFGLGLEGDFKAKVDFNFIKKIAEGIVFGLLSPKILLPIFVMLESIGQYAANSIQSIMDFAKNFGTFLLKIISRIGAIFIKKLFEIISKDIKQLLQSIIKDLAKEQADIRLIVVLKLIQLIIVIAEFVRDWRRCKSVIDEILWLLKIATSGWGNIPGFAGKVPYPLLIFSNFLDGASATREFIGTIQEMQKLGIPTGALPDGSPNLSMLAKFGQAKAAQREKAENGVVEIGVSPQDISPTRVMDGFKCYGKGF